MSAIGSVIVMMCQFFLAVVSMPDLRRFSVVEPDGAERSPSRNHHRLDRFGGLPAALGDAGELASVRHLPQADPAQAELAVDGLGAPAALAAGVAADRELRLAARLDLEGSLRHGSVLLEGEPE